MELAPMTQAKSLEGPATLGDVAERVHLGSEGSRDYEGVRLAHTRVRVNGTWMFQGEEARLSRHALSQLCARLELPGGGTVPAGYVARCPCPLAAENLNTWLAHPGTNGHEVLVRTQQAKGTRTPRVRAVLSNRYAVVDHAPLISQLRALAPAHRLSLAAWSLDDEQLTLRLLLDNEHPASLTDPIRVGLHIANSEVGLGRISIAGYVSRLVCSNGLVVKVADLSGLHRRHIGRAGEDLEEVAREALPRVLAEAEEAARRFIRLRAQPAPQPIEEFLRKTAREAELPETVLEPLQASLEGETLYDIVNGFTQLAQRFPVAERVRLETTMSQFLRDGQNWN